MTIPVVSIIIPCYNAGKFLERNLSSIIGQTFVSKEVIIVDGLSTDNSLEIARQFIKDHDYIQWQSGKDKGVYDAMNKGIGLARGEWIYFLGADDILYNDHVLSEVFSREISPKTGMIYGNVEFQYSKMIYNGEFDLKRILLGGNICHQAIFYRRSVFQELGLFDLNCKIYADHEFNIRCFRSKAFYKQYIGTVIACYNEQDGLSATVKNDPVFREKQLQYLHEFNRRPLQRMKIVYQQSRTALKQFLQSMKLIHGGN